MTETTQFSIEEGRTLSCETSANRSISIKDHMKFIKLVGSAFLASVVLVAVISIVIFSPSKKTTINVGEQLNITGKECHFVKRYSLGNRLNLTVCNDKENIYLDARASDTVSLRLSLLQWQRIKQIAPLIDKAIHEARTYWMRLKRLPAS